MTDLSDDLAVTFLIPCLNEEESLGAVIDEIMAEYLGGARTFEILVADNGSTDRSVAIACAAGARVVPIPARGYGAAVQGGISAARGRFTVMGDADGSYRFSDAKAMLDRLESGADLVMGNRFSGTIEEGAMPWLHRYVGNPALSAMGRIFFGVPVGDFHSGIRAFSTKSIRELGLSSLGMEFASEMLVLAAKRDLRIEEVPVTLRPDLRSRAPHLKTWRDGWRHLRFLLSHTPQWTFLLPAAVTAALAILIGIMSMFGPLNANGIEFSYRTSVIAMALTLVTAIWAWAFFLAQHLISGRTVRMPYFTELTMAASAVIAVAGGVVLIVQFAAWGATDFGAQPLGRSLLTTVWGALLLALGLSSFVLSMLQGLIRSFRR